MPPEFHEVDESRMQQEHSREVKRENPGGKFPLLFLKEGETVVRVLPPWSDEGIWYRKIFEHPAKNANGFFEPVICPKKMEDSECPFCEEGNKLYHAGGEDNVKAAKELRWQTKYFLNVGVISSPDPETNLKSGVKILKIGKKILDQILDYDQDASGGWGDITNLKGGLNLKIVRRGTGQFGTEYQVKPIPKRTNILDQFKEAGVESVEPFDLDAVVEIKSVDELKNVLHSQGKKVGDDFLEGLEDKNPEVPDVQSDAPSPPPPPKVS